MPTNLFPPDFATGWQVQYVNQNDKGDPVPGETMPLPGQDFPFHAGNWTPGEGKLWLNNSPLWAAVFQQHTLTPGAKYRMAVEVHFALKHGGQLAGDPISGQFRFFIGNSATSWLDGSSIPFGAYKLVSSGDLTPSVALNNIGFELRMRHPLAENFVFLRNPTLELISAPTTGDTGGTIPTPVSKYAAVKNRLALISTQTILLGNGVEALRYELQNAMIELERLENVG